MSADKGSPKRTLQGDKEDNPTPAKKPDTKADVKTDQKSWVQRVHIGYEDPSPDHPPYVAGPEVIRDALTKVDVFYTQGADPVAATRNFFAAAAAHLVETGYADACPIATVALEVASTNDQLRRATADVFESWISRAADRLVDAGIPPKKARELAIQIVASLEGAFILSRATRSTEAVLVAGEAATAAVRAALPARRRRKAAATA